MLLRVRFPTIDDRLNMARIRAGEGDAIEYHVNSVPVVVDRGALSDATVDALLPHQSYDREGVSAPKVDPWVDAVAAESSSWSTRIHP